MIFKRFVNLLPKGKGPLLLGISGGADSLCLLHILADHGVDLIPAHFDHQLRPESGREAEKVEGMVESAGFSLIRGQARVEAFAARQALTEEEAARILRYQFLFRQAEKERAEAVLVAHNADDQVETVVLNLLRGTGLDGLTGMKSVSLPNPWSDSIPLIRPLLSTWRGEIEAFLRDRGLEYLEDPSNQDMGYRRNWVRHRLLPSLDDVQPGFAQRLYQTAEILTGDQQILQRQERLVWKDLNVGEGPGYRSFVRCAFLDLLPGMQRRILRRAFSEVRPEFTEVSFDHIERSREFVQSETGTAELNLVGGMRIYLREENVYLAAGDAELPSGHAPQLDGANTLAVPKTGRVDLGEGWVLIVERMSLEGETGEDVHYPEDAFQAVVDAEQAGEDLTVGARREGERIQPLGMKGHSLKISDLMINEKVPEYLRASWPVVRSGDQVLWIPGLRIAHPFRIRADTRSGLILSLRRERA